MIKLEVTEREMELINDSLMSHVAEIVRLTRDNGYWDKYCKEITQLYERLNPLEKADPKFQSTGAGYER